MFNCNESEYVFKYITSIEDTDDLTIDDIKNIVWEIDGLGISEDGKQLIDEVKFKNQIVPEVYIALLRTCLDDDYHPVKEFVDFSYVLSNIFELPTSQIVKFHIEAFSVFYKELVLNSFSSLHVSKSDLTELETLYTTFKLPIDVVHKIHQEVLDHLVTQLITEFNDSVDEGVYTIDLLIKSSKASLSNDVFIKYNEFNTTKTLINDYLYSFKSDKIKLVGNESIIEDSGTLYITDTGIQFTGIDKGINLPYKSLSNVILNDELITINKLRGNTVYFNIELDNQSLFEINNDITNFLND